MSGVIQVSGIWKKVINTLSKAEIISLAPKLKALAQTPIWIWRHKLHCAFEGLNTVFSNQFEISGLPETWTTPNKLYDNI